ncbi:L,D-transpeptidase family protein [Streptomyces sp. NPDC059002]|uniref:L,D-transpeptidase family protein n=1 Tax=Streptomyces sp. NPDC059002 TaxID=3346690 RepID=UPI0036B45CDD
MRIAGAVRAAVVMAACGVLVTSCGSGDDSAKKQDDADPGQGKNTHARAVDPKRIPDVGDRFQSKIPKNSQQVLAVYGEGEDSAKSSIVLYTKSGPKDATWEKTRSWSGHNGRKGWTTNHREDDKRSPVGVFTLTDAGGVLPDPGAKLSYSQSTSMQAPHYWPKPYWHDFDYVIAIDYNRVKGTPPSDPTRPQGRSKGGSMWVHMDHGSGTSGCVSLSKSGMEYLLRTLDPKLHPVVVMGDKANLKAG